MKELLKYAEQGNTKAIKHILGEHEGDEKEGLLRTVDASGNTMLHLAARSASAQCLTYLLEVGVPVAMANKMGHLPLHIAASNNQGEATELLVNNMVAQGHSLAEQNSVGGTALHSACASGSKQCVLVLLRHGINVNVEDKHIYGNTPLHKSVYEAHEECAKLLLSQFKAKVNFANKDGDTALHKAAERGHLTFIQLLVDNGATVNAENKEKNTPLHQACARGHTEVAKQLVTLGASLNAANTKGYTPFHNAISHAKDELLKNPTVLGTVSSYLLFLMGHGASTEAKAQNNKTPKDLAPSVLYYLFDPVEVEKRRENERKRKEEEERKRKEEEERRIEEERLLAEEMKRREEENRRKLEEERRLAEEAEQQRKLEEERKRKEEEEALEKAKKKKKKKKKGTKEGDAKRSGSPTKRSVSPTKRNSTPTRNASPAQRNESPTKSRPSTNARSKSPLKKAQ